MSEPFFRRALRALQAGPRMTDQIADATRRVDRINKKRSSEHGDADWMSLPHQVNAGLMMVDSRPAAPFLGAISGQWQRYGWQNVYHITGNFTHSYSGDRHLLTVAANGGGKSSAVAIPNLLIDRCSTIVTDTKSELAEATGSWREQKLNQRVWRLAPFATESDGRRNRYNPLDLVRHSGTPEAVAMAFSHALVPEKPGEKNPFFTSSARQMLGGLIVYVCFSPDFHDHQRHLGTVYTILTGSLGFRADVYEMMTKAPVAYVRQEGNKALDRLNRSNGDDVLATLWASLDFFNSPQIIECLSSSDFDLKTFRDTPQTLYLSLPGFLNEACAGWMRLMLISVFTAVEMCGTAPPGPPSIRLYLDEFASLGSFWKMLEQYPRARGYGMQFWIFVQSFVQLQHAFQESWTTFFENAGVVQCFGGLSGVTADFIIKHLGNRTVHSQSAQSWSAIPQPLMTINQLGRMAPREQILLYKGHQPVRSYLQPYYLADTGMDGWIKRHPLRARPTRVPKPSSGERRPPGSAVSLKRRILCPCKRVEMNVPTNRGEIKVTCHGCKLRFNWSPD